MLMPMIWSNNDIFDEMENLFNDGFFGTGYTAPRTDKHLDSTRKTSRLTSRMTP